MSLCHEYLDFSVIPSFSLGQQYKHINSSEVCMASKYPTEGFWVFLFFYFGNYFYFVPKLRGIQQQHGLLSIKIYDSLGLHKRSCIKHFGMWTVACHLLSSSDRRTFGWDFPAFKCDNLIFFLRNVMIILRTIFWLLNHHNSQRKLMNSNKNRLNTTVQSGGWKVVG